MADIRINALATTAASTASDDFVAVDGSANGTRKLNAYSPSFGGNLTVTGTASVTGQINGSAGYQFRGASATTYELLRYAGGTNNPGIFVSVNESTKKTTIIASGSVVGGQTLVLGAEGAETLTLGAANATLAGNLTVSGYSDIGGAVRATGATVPATGAGVEVQYFSAIGKMLSYDRGASAWKPLQIDGSYVALGYNNGNVLIGTTTDGGQKLQVNGTGRFFGAVGNSNGSGFVSYGPNGTDTGARIWCFSDGAAYIDAGATTGTDAGKLFLRTGSSLNTALTLDASQNATFAGKVTPTGGIVGVTTNSSAAAGNVGEIITSTVESGSAVSLTSAVVANVTSISLTAGDWDVTGVVGYETSSATVSQFLQGSNNASAALGPTGSFSKAAQSLSSDTNSWFHLIPTYRLSLSGTSTVYLLGRSTFSAGTVSAYGFIRARRVR